MARSMFFCVSDDPVMVQKAREFGQVQGITVQVFSVSQWAQGLNNPSFRGTISPDVPTLTGGMSSFSEGAKVLPFPGTGSNSYGDANGKSVATINELEAQAIDQAIQTFRGNLTEAAKALGIGRATLYRKVKQYNIDPSDARRKKVA
jgi:hypothetical protein